MCSKSWNIDGWDGWIRTSEVPESKSGALPLGYTPPKEPDRIILSASRYVKQIPSIRFFFIYLFFYAEQHRIASFECNLIAAVRFLLDKRTRMDTLPPFRFQIEPTQTAIQILCCQDPVLSFIESAFISKNQPFS